MSYEPGEPWAGPGEHDRMHAEILTLVIQAQEAERARVARDLHDEIGQALTSVLLGLRLVEGSLDGTPGAGDEVRARTAEVRELVADALRRVRSLAFDLRPTVLDDLGLLPALRRLVSETGERHGVEVDLVVDGFADDARLAPAVETVVYRVVQEALTNVIRHSRASAADVVVSRDPERASAVVEDDGRGFDPAGVASTSLGLAGMRERAALVGGNVTIESEPGSGTTVRLEVPLG